MCAVLMICYEASVFSVEESKGVGYSNFGPMSVQYLPTKLDGCRLMYRYIVICNKAWVWPDTETGRLL
jgi:hypothetical protein